MNDNPHSGCKDEIKHFEYLLSQINHLLNESYKELANKIGDCIFDSEEFFIIKKVETEELHTKITDEYVKHIDGIISRSHQEMMEQFEVATKKYQAQIVAFSKQK